MVHGTQRGTILDSRRALFAMAIAVACGMLCAAAYGQSLTWLGTYGTPVPYAESHGVSADGSVVSGWAGTSSPHIAFRWTADTGMEDIGSLAPNRDTEAWGLSADGRVIVGYGFVSSGIYRGFRWENGAFMQFGTLGGDTSWAYAASGDGSVVVGAAQVASGFNHAFRWTPGSGMVDLGVLPGAVRSVGRAVSLDGEVVAGWSGFGTLIHHAFRWQNGVMTDIHNPAFGNSEALGISGDGNTVVGAWAPTSWVPTLPFRWTSSTGMVDLGTLGGQWGEAWATSNDGSVIVGWSDRDPGETSEWAAFRWTPSGGMEDLNVTYASLIPPGSRLEWASAVSPDGRFIVGNGINNARYEAFLLDTATCPGDLDGDGDTDLSDLAALLAAYGTFSGDPNYNPAADFDSDGDVDLADLAFLLADYGCLP